jgi:hypothetical protein
MRIHEAEYRYTAKPGVVYVIAFQQTDSPMRLKAFAGLAAKIKSAALLGADSPVEWSLDAEEDWVEIAAVWGSTAQLNVIESKLRAAGIPHTVSQRPYGERPGLPVGVYPSRVKVPPHLMRQARQSISGPAVVPSRVPSDAEEIRSLDEPALGEPAPGEPVPDERIPAPSGEYMPEERPERPWWFQLAMILIVFAFVGLFLCRFLGDAIDSLLTAFG